MRSLRDECRIYGKSFRKRAAKVASKDGGIIAAKKFDVDHNTVLKWRAEFGFPKFTGAR
jgi:transposase-like protein